jgi:hypothetical protein
MFPAIINQQRSNVAVVGCATSLSEAKARRPHHPRSPAMPPARTLGILPLNRLHLARSGRNEVLPSIPTTARRLHERSTIPTGVCHFGRIPDVDVELGGIPQEHVATSNSVTINRRQSRKRQNLWLRESNCLDVRGDDFSPCFS